VTSERSAITIWPVDPENSDDRAVTRRRALRAAIGTGIAAAAWNAPRIEGLSITPTYAAAATAAPPGTVDGVKVVEVIAAGGRACNNANSETFPAGLPGVSFTIVDKLCQSGFEFSWSISPGNCMVTGMYCTEAAALLGTPVTPGFVAGSGQTLLTTCFPQSTLGGLWIDVVCT